MIFSSFLKKFRTEEPKPKEQSNTHGWIKCKEMDTAPGYSDIGTYDPDLLSSAISRFLSGYPACVSARLSIYNGYLLLSPVDGDGRYMAVSPIVEEDE